MCGTSPTRPVVAGGGVSVLGMNPASASGVLTNCGIDRLEREQEYHSGCEYLSLMVRLQHSLTHFPRTAATLYSPVATPRLSLLIELPSVPTDAFGTDAV